MTSKKTTKKKKSSSTGPVLQESKQQKSEVTAMCLRWVDQNTYVVSDDKMLRPVSATEMPKIPKGCVKVDDHTIVKAQ